MKKSAEHPYRRTQKTTRRTESKSKDGAKDAKEMYVTYDVPRETRSGDSVLYPKVKRVYITGKVSGWRVGGFANRTGRKVHGVKIEYEQNPSRSRAGREAPENYKIRRGNVVYKVLPLHVAGAASHLSQVVEVPKDAQNVKLYTGKLPRKYQAALPAAR